MPKERRPHRLLRKAERCVQVLQRRRRHLKPTPCNYFTCLSNAAVEKESENAKFDPHEVHSRRGNKPFHA